MPEAAPWSRLLLAHRLFLRGLFDLLEPAFGFEEQDLIPRAEDVDGSDAACAVEIHDITRQTESSLHFLAVLVLHAHRDGALLSIDLGDLGFLMGAVVLVLVLVGLVIGY